MHFCEDSFISVNHHSADPDETEKRMPSVTSFTPVDTPLDLDSDRLVNLLYQMQLTRAFEETAFDQYSQGKVHGTMHLYVGEEAAAIGSIAALRPDDLIVST